mgnify:CR=1 FL=1|jgi:hypothetical protein
MYSLRHARRALESPHLTARELNRLYHTRGHRRTNPDGIDVFAEDWDNLLILDSCRYDMFEECHTLPGRLESRRSKGSHTSEFLQANVTGRDLRDTVYVTASPMYYRNRDDLDARFHEVVEVWKEGGWHKQYRTVTPGSVVEYATGANDRYPDKRLLVHFLQPHYPFIGETGLERFDLDSLAFEWDAVADGEVDVSDRTLRRAFRENLEIALPHVERLMRTLPGRTVVSADHGQVIGDRSWPLPIREYGHPDGTYIDALVKVPWLVFENGPRKTVRHGDADGEVGRNDGPAVGRESADSAEASPEAQAAQDDERENESEEDLVEQRLESLGYL